MAGSIFTSTSPWKQSKHEKGFEKLTHTYKPPFLEWCHYKFASNLPPLHYFQKTLLVELSDLLGWESPNPSWGHHHPKPCSSCSSPWKRSGCACHPKRCHGWSHWHPDTSTSFHQPSLGQALEGCSHPSCHLRARHPKGAETKDPSHPSSPCRQFGSLRMEKKKCLYEFSGGKKLEEARWWRKSGRQQRIHLLENRSGSKSGREEITGWNN